MKVRFLNATPVDLNGDGKIHCYRPNFVVDLPKEKATALIKAGYAVAEKGERAENAMLSRA